MQRLEDLTIIGLMSGTSLDGVDLACCRFVEADGVLDWTLLAAETIPYDEGWRVRLSSLEKASAYEYALADVQLGHYFGCLVRDFVKKHGLQVEYVASHGHTIFHQPQLGLTTQIGDGDSIAAECGLPVVFNFRTLDVALGGQGAPLVPIGDRLLFGDSDACLNLSATNYSLDNTTPASTSAASRTSVSNNLPTHSRHLYGALPSISALATWRSICWRRRSACRTTKEARWPGRERSWRRC